MFNNLKTLESPGNLRVALDAHTAIPVRMVWETADQKPVWRWEASKIKEVDGYHFPEISAFFDLSHGEKLTRINYETITVEFNKRFEGNFFRIAPAPGVRAVGRRRGRLRPRPFGPGPTCMRWSSGKIRLKRSFIRAEIGDYSRAKSHAQRPGHF